MKITLKEAADLAQSTMRKIEQAWRDYWKEEVNREVWVCDRCEEGYHDCSGCDCECG